MSLFRKDKKAEKPSYIDEQISPDIKLNIIADLENVINCVRCLYHRLDSSQWQAVFDELGPTATILTTQIVRGMMVGTSPMDSARDALSKVKLPIFINELVIRATMSLRDEPDNG